MTASPVPRSYMLTRLTLASASPVRARLLRDAGIEVEIRPARVDEEEVRLALANEGASAARVAATLAELKAVRGSRDVDSAVIGADQVLIFDGVLLNKPDSVDAARRQLTLLRGRSHELTTAVCVAKGGNVIWHSSDTARLTMRPFSDDVLDAYLSRNAATVVQSVGGYQIEGEGLQLFDRIEGDFFTILGLPLFPLLEFLRQHGALLS